MDILTILGLVMGLGVVYYVMVQGEITALLFNINAFLLVFGGTLASTMITYPWSVLKRLPRAMFFVLRPPKSKDISEVINKLVNIQTVSQSRGVDAISDELSTVDDSFMITGLRMLMEDQPPEVIRENLDNELTSIRHRHMQVIGVFRAMGSYAPIFGLLGTLIGVVQVLRNLDNPSAMGASMAIAITTTFYGIFGSNFIFLPIAGKLDGYSSDEVLMKELIMAGVVSISEGVLPALLRQRLERFITEEQRAKMRSAVPAVPAV